MNDRRRDDEDLAELVWTAVVSAMRNDGDPDGLYRLLNRRDRMTEDAREAVDDALVALTGMGAVELLNRAEEQEDDDLPGAVLAEDEENDFLNF
jgi:hypothetical protein